MAIFIVKTNTDRHLFISANTFFLETSGMVYVFLDKESAEPVASVPVKDVFAVLTEDAFAGEFYERFEEPDSDPEPTGTVQDEI